MAENKSSVGNKRLLVKYFLEVPLPQVSRIFHLLVFLAGLGLHAMPGGAWGETADFMLEVCFSLMLWGIYCTDTNSGLPLTTLALQPTEPSLWPPVA